MPEQVTGSCLCGAVQFCCRLPSLFCAHCHCNNCRRAHGAAFVTWVGFPEDKVSVTAGLDKLSAHLSASQATRSFCGECGSTLFYKGPRWEGELHVVRANLHGELDREPGAEVYVDHKASWWEIRSELPQRGGESGVEPR